MGYPQFQINSMIFKTILSDVNKVALAIEGLQNIEIFGTVNQLNSTSLNSFVKGIDGLTLSQANAALSTRALTDAQKEQILISAGLIQSTKEMTIEEVKQMASNMALSAEKKEEILVTLQGAYSENEWNMERLEAIANAGGEAGAIAKSIIAKKAENAENTKNIAGRKALVVSLKEELATRLALLASNPVAWIAGIAAVSVGLIVLQNKLSKSLKECTEELKNYNSEFENTKSSIESLETELKTCRDRLDELKTIADNGTISIVEQEEYERLQKTNDELERNLRIEREKAQLGAVEGAKTADETLGKTVESKYETSWQDMSGIGVTSQQAAWITPEKELNAAIEEYSKLQEELDSLNDSFDKGKISPKEYEEQLSILSDKQLEARTRASEMSDILVDVEQSYNNLISTGGKLTSTQTNNYNIVTEANTKYNDFLNTINDINKVSSDFNNTEDDVSSSIEDTTTSLDSTRESVTNLTEEYTLLQEILKDTSNVSEETYTKLLACSSKYSAALKTESGRLVVNKNKLLAVAKSRSKDQKETIKQAVAQKKLEYLKQAKYLKVYDNQLIDTTSDTYDNITAIQEEITQYQLLAEQLDSATSAFERFKEAQQTDNTPQNDTANDAFKTIKEGLESGQVGTDDFRTAQELLMGAKEYQEFLKLGNSAENPLEKQYLYMEKWQNKTKQFFGEDMKQNVINFLDALDATGLLQDGMLASSSKIGEELGLSLDSVNALVEGVNTFGFKDIIQQSQIDFVDEYAERIQNLNDTKEAYYKAEESRDGKENNNYIEGLKQDWQDEQTAYDQFMQSLPNRYADIVSAFESSGTDKSFADYFTDAIGGNENALAFTEAVGDGIGYINDKISDLNHQGIFSSEEIDNLNTVKDSLLEMRQQLSKSTNTFLKDSDTQKYVDLLAKKKKLEGTEKTSSNASQIASELSDVQSQLDSLAKPTVIELQLNKSAIDAQISEVEAQIRRLDSVTAKIDVGSGQAGAYQAINAITNAKNQASGQLQGLKQQSQEYEVAIKYVTDTSEMDEAIDSIPENTESKVTFNVNGVSELQKANDIIKGLSDKTITVNVNTTGAAGLSNLGNKMGGGMPSNVPVVNGTAHANGTNLALKSNEKGALVGELGTEGLVRDGKFYLIGEHGTQFMDLKKDDIVFNHKQVEQLQKNGHITGRGKMVGGAYVDGTLVGTAHADVNNRYNSPYIKSGAEAINQNQALKKASKEVEDTIDETTEDIEEASEEIFDWIERRVKKLQRLYDRWISNAEKTFSTKFVDKFFSHANSNLNKQLKTQSAAFNRYMQEANNSGLSDDYKQKVADGLIDIEKIADENLSKQINDYQNWYNNATLFSNK